MGESSSGVYEIKNIKNGKKYIGSSLNIEKRWKNHRSYLEGGYHDNLHLQNAWHKYGGEKFEFEIIEETDQPLKLEQKKLDYFLERDEWGRLYNISKDATKPPMTEETKKKMAEAKRGKEVSEETRQKMSEAKRGMYVGENHPQSSLTRDEVREIRKRYKKSSLTQRDLAKQYGVRQNTISYIIRGNRWPDAPGPIKGEDY